MLLGCAISTRKLLDKHFVPEADISSWRDPNESADVYLPAREAASSGNTSSWAAMARNSYSVPQLLRPLSNTFHNLSSPSSKTSPEIDDRRGGNHRCTSGIAFP